MSIEIEFINLNAVEYAHKRAVFEQQRNNQTFADIGMRVARARDPKLLATMEKAVALLISEEETQRKHQMAHSNNFSERRYTTETQMWREAYRMIDESKANDVPHLMWIYGAGAFLCGYQI
jgi:single-stranded DNA-specific DHH superfamily exonuclease